MSYTVKKLSQISGVSVRTLHYYDEIDLLKPAYIGANGYRYYEEEQLLLLQQILFFRELGMELKDIRNILGRSDFDQLAALSSHRKILLKKMTRLKELVTTIDKTINHLKGNKIMNTEELYYGFDSPKQKAYEKEIRKIVKEKKIPGTEAIFSDERTKNWTKEDWEDSKRESDAMHRALAELEKQGLEPDAPEVQEAVRRHFHWINRFYTPTKEVYCGLGELYCEHPGFRKFFDAYGISPEFLAQGMKIFAEREL